jgi:lysophospholipase
MITSAVFPDWIRIASEVGLNYHLFDAFVILHGTDTMCYTSSALSFLLEDLGKTVVHISPPDAFDKAI